MDRYLIIGGSGFIGLQLTKKLCEAGFEVVVADRIKPDYIHENLEYININYNTNTDFEAITKNITHVIHSLTTTTARNFKSVYNDFEENVMPTIKVLDACVKNKIQKFVFLSSGGTVYGEPHANVKLKEEEAGNAISSYGAQKYVNEQIFSLYNHMHNLDYSICRIANIYGAGQTISRGVGVVPTFISKMLLNEEISIIGDGEMIRDYIYVEDTIDAIIKISHTKTDNKIYNIGTGVGYSVNEVLAEISKQLNITPKVSYAPTHKLDVSYNVLDITKLEKDLHFTPKYSLEQGVCETIHSIKNALSAIV